MYPNVSLTFPCLGSSCILVAKASTRARTVPFLVFRNFGKSSKWTARKTKDSPSWHTDGNSRPLPTGVGNSKGAMWVMVTVFTCLKNFLPNAGAVTPGEKGEANE